MCTGYQLYFVLGMGFCVEFCIFHVFKNPVVGSAQKPNHQYRKNCIFARALQHINLHFVYQGKSKKVQHPEILPLPTSSKINHISVAKDAGHAVLIAENGEVYFVGTAHRGEDGEASE